MFERLIPNRSHRYTSDDRAVSEVLGAILVFALIILLLVLIQANAVPAANKQVEFEHSQRINQDFQSLQEGLYRAGTTGTDVSIPMETGVVYPSRFFLLNPPPSTGTIETTGAEPLVIDNALASGEVGEYWDGQARTFTTTGLRYRPDYNELGGSGVKNWKHSTVYTDYGDAVVFDDETGFIDGNRIRLTLVDGTLSFGGVSTAVEVAPISTQRRTIAVTNEPGQDLTIQIQTGLDIENLRKTLDETKVESVTKSGDTATITLKDDTYELSIAKVRVGSSQVEQPGTAYITDTGTYDRTISEGVSQRMVVEVRDQYNNPVSGKRVGLQASAGSIKDSEGNAISDGSVVQDMTNSDGQLVIDYTGPDISGTENQEITVTAWIGPDPTDAEPDPPLPNPTDVSEERKVTFDLTVENTDRSGLPPGDATSDGVSGINPGGDDDVVLVGVCSPGNPTTLYFENRGQSTTLEEARLLFHQGQQVVDKVYISSNGGTETTLPAGGFFTSLEDPVSLPADDTVSVEVRSDGSKLSQNDLLGLSFRFTSTQSNYFVTVRKLELLDFKC